MALKIYNSLTGQKEEFTPLEPGKVKMYVCGPTVYDEPHIGHLRSAYVFDVMRRYLEYSGYNVTFVRNVTDVDDKIIQKARDNGAADLLSEVKNISKKYLAAYKQDLKTLGIQEPTKEPKATEHIQDMVWLIERLLKSQAAYESQGDVYFDVNASKDYGKLSHQKKDEMLDNVRHDANEKKKNPLDFALWKRSKEGEPSWDSPWGKGRPGWHIECSAMSMKYLGQTFDIHGGGLDLKFPHHENEIAQSEAVTCAEFAHYWVHHGLVTVGQQKMSKSQQNFITLKGFKEAWDDDFLKFLFLTTHYRAAFDFSIPIINRERSVTGYQAWRRFDYFFEDMGRRLKAGIKPKVDAKTENFINDFKKAMDDDFNTPQAMTVMHEMMHFANKTLDDGIAVGISETLKNLFNRIYGIFLRQEVSDPYEEKIIKLIDERKQARSKNNYNKADEIRNALLAEAIELIDTKDGETHWRRKI